MTNMSKDNMKAYIAKERKRILKQKKAMLEEAKEVANCGSITEFLDSEMIDESARDSILDEVGHINGQVHMLRRLEEMITKIPNEYQTFTFTPQASVNVWNVCEHLDQCEYCELVGLNETEIYSDKYSDLTICDECRKARAERLKGKRKYKPRGTRSK